MNRKIKKIVIIITWLFIWQTAAVLTDNNILLAGPLEVGKTLGRLLLTADFYAICAASMGRILLGFCMAFILGFLLGALSYHFSLIREITEPVLNVMKSIPVASFVVLLLIWQGAGNLSVWISFFVVFPNICVSTRNGFMAAEVKLKEMAAVFGIGGIRKGIYIYRPTLIPYLISAMEISIGMAFKSGVAAEVIGVPDCSIGERIYTSKIYLDTPGLFAWTIALICLSYFVEKMLLRGMRLLLKPVKLHGTGQRSDCLNKESGKIQGKEIKEAAKAEIKLEAEAAGGVSLSHISKSFGERSVLSDVSMELEKGGCYLLMGPSGSGKTTLLRILAGLETADAGNVEFPQAAHKEGRNGREHRKDAGLKTAYLFQEDRMLENELTITNIMLTAKGSGEARVQEAVSEILPASCMYKTADTLSGGMKRRCALARTLLYRLDDKAVICLLDEPFVGLDEETKRKTAKFIRKYQNGRTLIVATHDEQDAELLGGSIWRIAE